MTQALDRFRRARAFLFWAAPPLISLELYWPGLTAWFQKDDFVWLGLRAMVHSWHDLWWALFAPLAQGTIRTLSERVFYMSLNAAFGLKAFPYRLWAFLTFAATLTMLSAVCTKLTRSRAAGFWAAIIWAVNSALAYALSWTAIYYQLFCSFFLLLSFWFLLRYVEKGKRRFHIAQCAVFLLGFLVLELNVVYPALAAAYAICCARRIVWKIAPLFLASAAYTGFHVTVAPLQSTGPYKMFWDAGVFSTLWTYWKMALGPNRLMLLGIYPSAFRSVLTIALMAGLLGFLTWKLYQREWVAAFFPAWFVIVLAPLLPLRDHVTDSYLTVPLIGLAMWGGWAAVSGWRAGWGGRVATVALLAVYLGVSIPVARATAAGFSARSHQIRGMLFGIVALNRRAPGKTLILKGVDSGMFWDAFYHRPLRLFGINDAYLALDDREQIAASDPGAIQPFIIDPAQARIGLASQKAVVFDVSGTDVRDVTDAYYRHLTDR